MEMMGHGCEVALVLRARFPPRVGSNDFDEIMRMATSRASSLGDQNLKT